MAAKAKDALKGAADPVEVTIKHGYFHYHEPHERIVDGEVQEFWIERIAWCGDTVVLTKQSDIDKGEEHGAFLTDGEQPQASEPAEFATAEDYDDADPDAKGDDE